MPTWDGTPEDEERERRAREQAAQEKAEAAEKALREKLAKEAQKIEPKPALGRIFDKIRRQKSDGKRDKKGEK